MLALIDCAIREPVVECVNDIIQLWGGPVQYHLPAMAGLSSLKRLDEAKAVIVLGSDSSVNDLLPWQLSLVDELKLYLKKPRPVMGVCFGHQLFASLYGGEVGFVSAGQEKLKGSRSLKFLEKFGEIQKGEELRLAVSHREKVSQITSDFNSLADSGVSHDALVHKDLPLWSFQAHPEASSHFLEKPAQKLSDSDRQAIKSDGNRVIRSFFQEISAS